MFPWQRENTAVMEEMFSTWSVPRCYNWDQLAIGVSVLSSERAPHGMKNVTVRRIPLWDVAIYICKDNHVSIYSIIFITIVQYTQMYLNNCGVGSSCFGILTRRTARYKLTA
jgi:hypothetical protein